MASLGGDGTREAAPLHQGPVGTAALPRSDLVQHNLTTFRLPNGQCVQRAVSLPEMSCSLPFCNHTANKGVLMLLTNQRLRKWAGFMRFDLSALQLRDGARLVDVELRLSGTAQCHLATANFTHQLHLLRANQDPLTIPINRAYPRRLTAQWSNQAFSSRFRVPLNLNGRQLSMVGRTKRLNFVLTEKLFGNPDKHPTKMLKKTCAYYSAANSKPQRWPRLIVSYAFACCAGREAEDDDEQPLYYGVDSVSDGGKSSARHGGGGGGGGSGGGGGGGSGGEEANEGEGEADGGGGGGATEPARHARPAWIDRQDWKKLPHSRRPAPVHFHSRLGMTPPPWVYGASVDAGVAPCALPASRAEAAGGQLAPPLGEPPAVSVIVAYHNHENMTAQSMLALFACASELPSAEYLFVDDGSDEVTGELPALLRRLASEFGIRFQIDRYEVSVGFTLACTEAARRATGTHLLFLNNDAFVRENALRALHGTFATHADVGVVGAKLVGHNDTMQEAGAIVWSGGTGAWFLKNSRLRTGRDNEGNHRLNYVRETDYVSAACAMVRRDLFVGRNMFDFHFSPGYYEDTDLAFTVRAAGLRVLYQPFAHVVHQSHTTYAEADRAAAESMDSLIARNRRHFTSKWQGALRSHMPPCEVASACTQPHKTMYTHLAATRMYTYRMLWMDMILPEPDRDSGSVRDLVVLKILLAMRVHVSIVTVQRSGKGRHERYMRMLQYMGVHVIPSFHMMRAFTIREPYDFILVARRDTFAAVRDILHRHYPNTLLVYDTVDLHFARERARRAFIEAHASDPQLLESVFGANVDGGLSNATEHARLREIELDAVSASAVAVVVSEEEGEQLRLEMEAAGREPVRAQVIANAHEPQPRTTTPFARRRGLVFVGNFNHLPNRDAVLYFAREVLPRLARAPRVRDDAGFVFHVIGSNAIPQSVLELNGTVLGGHPRVVIHGYVPSLRPLFAKARLSVAPLRWGAGVKGKINSAHQLGVPVVCTSLAVSGMHAVDGEHALLADTPHALAAAVLNGYYNATTWHRLMWGGRRLLERRFSASRAATGVLEVLALLRETNTLMGMKSLAITDARPRIYADLRAASALGGYFFNFTKLDAAAALEISQDIVPHDDTCGGGANGDAEQFVSATPDSNYVLKRIASSGG